MKKKIKIFSLIIVLLLSLCLTGCSNDKVTENDAQNNEVAQTEDTTNENKEEKETKTPIRLNGTSEFKDGIAVLGESINYQVTNYIVDDKFNVLSTYEGNGACVDGYVIRENTDKSFSILDKNGKEVLVYGEHEYEDVKLLGNGCVYLKTQTDTYNSSVTMAGIYDLSVGKYVVEPNEQYLSIYEQGDNMYELSDDKVFFNTKTKKIVTYTEVIYTDFVDGYTVKEVFEQADQSNYLLVWDDNGGFKKIKEIYSVAGASKTHENGMLFASTMDVYHDENGNEKIKMYSALYNLESGESFDFGSEEYSMPTNDVKFTTSGYALLTFNNQGGTPYYTIIDKKGNKQFEPIKVNDNAAFQPDDNGEKRIIRLTDLYEGNYLIVEEDGVDTVLDMNNNILVQAEEYETFNGVTNGVVKVFKKQPGYADEHYYKDLKGNRIQIYK